MKLRTCWSIPLIGIAMAVVLSAAQPMKALIVDGRMNKAHHWKEDSAILKRQLEETGLFSIDFATAPEGTVSGFHPAFANYRLVVFNYNDEVEWPEATKKAFVDYVRGGGGLVIYHAANNAFPKWKEFNEMAGVGGWGGRNEKDGPYVRWRDGKVVFDMTPGPAGAHGPQHEFQIEVRAPEHPIMKGLPLVFMHSADELYNRLRGPAKNLTLLATAFSPPNQKGTGEHEAVLMAIRYGRGRVFHTTIGHNAEQLRSVAFIATFQRGAEWAATGKVTQKIPSDFPGADKPRLR